MTKLTTPLPAPRKVMAPDEFEAAGQNWLFRLHANELCDIETATGKRTTDIIADLQTASVATLRAVLVAGLRDAEGDKAFTERDRASPEGALAVLESLGMEKTLNMIVKHIEAFFA